MSRFSLRFRVFLFFAALGLGSVAIVLGALWLGHGRVAPGGESTAGFVTAATLSAFGILALTAGIWLLFDENVARPVQRLAAELRARAHGGVRAPLAAKGAQHLGDLGPAAQAVADALSAETLEAATRLSSHTATLESERNRLTALLTEIPVATLLVTADDRIALYDGQAAEVLAQIAPPRLGAAVTDYFDPSDWARLRKAATRSGQDQTARLAGRHGGIAFSTRLKPMQDGGLMAVIDDETATVAPNAARPLVYDFALADQAVDPDVMKTPLDALAYTVFDTETTGLLPHKDAVVQIGAVRVLGGRLVPGEVLDTLVDPGRPIPAAASAVHHVTNAMVAGAPPIATAGRRLHDLAQGSVIVAHNAPFDMAFLRRDAAAMGVAWDHPILDTVLLSAVVFGAEQTHTLDALCDRLDITIPAEHRHTALGDAIATAKALLGMLPMLKARGLTTLGAVIDETRRHARLLTDLN